MDTRRSVALELAAIGAAAAVFVATFRVRPPYLDFALAAAAVALIVLSAGRSTRLWQSAAPLVVAPSQRRTAWLASATFTVAALLALAALGALGAFVQNDAQDSTWPSRAANWHIVVAMALYFPWALLQQYIFQFYLLGRLLQLVGTPVAIALTALAFSCVHFPRWPVMIVVAIAGTVWSLIYYRTRALLPLAASHAMLGSALHYWVFGHDLLDAWLP